MNKPYRKVLLMFSVLVLVLTVFVLFVPFYTAVAIEGENCSRYLPCYNNEKMIFEFEHSMYRVPQREYYTIEKPGFLLNSVYFGDANAASYYDARNVYVYSKNADGSYEILDMNQFYPELRYALAHGTKYTLRIGARVLDFNEQTADSVHFKIRVTNASLFTLLYGK